MKRFFVLFAVALVLAVAAPVLAGPFSDVPQDHWAYSALEKLQATGIITGYADGTFQGKNTLTRYEIAVIVSRLLDQVAAERALLAEKVDALENGLTAGQAEDVIAIFKSLYAKQQEEEQATQQPEQPTIVEKETVVKEVQTEVVFPETLTDAQAAEVVSIVEALTLEFKFELEALGAKVDALTTKVDGLDTRVAALEAKPVTWKGYYELNINRTDVEGTGLPFFNPFKKDNDGSESYDKQDGQVFDEYYDYYSDAYDMIRSRLNLGANVKVGQVIGDINVVRVTDVFTSAPADAWTEMSAKVTGNGLSVLADRGQTNVWAPFLFSLDDPYVDLYDGVKVSYNNDQYILFTQGATNPLRMLGMKKDLGLFGTTLYAATPDVMRSKDFVAGIVSPVDLFVDFTTTAAVEKAGNDYLKYVHVNGKKDLGPLSIEGNYVLNRDGFAGYNVKEGTLEYEQNGEYKYLEEGALKGDGYDVKANLNLFGEALKLNARYADKRNSAAFDTRYGAGAELAVGPLTAEVDKDFAQRGTDKADRTLATVDVDQKISFLNVNVGYTYDQYNDDIMGNIHWDDDGIAATPELVWDTNLIYTYSEGEYVGAADEFNHGYANITANLFIPGLTASANYRYSQADDGYYAWNGLSAVGLSRHDYSLNWKYGIANAGLTYDVFFARQTYTAGLDPKAINVLGFSIDPVAGLRYRVFDNKTKDPVMNYNVGVDVKKALNAKSNLTYSFLLDDRQISAWNALTGGLTKHVVKVDYALSDSLSATASYTNLDFDGYNVANSYKVQELKSYLKFTF